MNKLVLTGMVVTATIAQAQPAPDPAPDPHCAPTSVAC